MGNLPLRPLTFGEIVDGAVQLYRRDFAFYYLIALIAAVPGYVAVTLLPVDFDAVAAALQSDDPSAATGHFAPFALVNTVWLAFTLVGSVAGTVAMVERIAGRPISVASAYARTLGHLPSAAGAAFLSLLGLALAALFVMLVLTLTLGAGFMMTDHWVFISLSAGVGVLAMVGLVLLWAGVTFGVVPAVVTEGRTAAGALGRSLSLFWGGRLRVLGILIVAMVIQVAPNLGIQWLFGLGDLYSPPELLGSVSPERQWLWNTIDFVVGALTFPFLIGATLVLFHDRRVRTEAYDLETRANALETG